jgi:DNA replication and repair protein RecF
VLLERIWLRDFRSYTSLELELDAGLTVVTGANGSGKTNLLEAIGYLATQRSFRGHPTDALVRTGADRAVVRAEGRDGDRSLLLEAEIVPGGRSRFLLNRQPVRRVRDLASTVRVSVFTPDDLELVKGGPGERRTWIDDLLAAVHRRHAAVQDDLERILRQRNALLKSLNGRPDRLDESAAVTLDVWDTKLAEVGAAVVAARLGLLEALTPLLDEAYAVIAGSGAAQAVSGHYEASWLPGPVAVPPVAVPPVAVPPVAVPPESDGPARSAALARVLVAALLAGRAEDVRRGLSLVGPHRDDIVWRIAGRNSRTHASQGEQRTLALAMRLAGHRHVAAVAGSSPILLLDDVFSELDPARCAALIAHLPAGQALLASAQRPPSQVGPHTTVVTELPGPVGPVDGAGPDGATTQGGTQVRRRPTGIPAPGDNSGETVEETAPKPITQHEVTRT